MGLMRTKALVAASRLLPDRNWFPIEAWEDERYAAEYARRRAQPDDLEAQRVASRDVEGPLFSIVVPLFETPREFLEDMAESVLAQTYPRFELVLVNASPELAELGRQVDALAASDGRVKVVRLEGNLGITENTNRGMAAASGDFVCFMDHDDWIEPDTLFEYAAAVREHGDIDLMYCDEDLVEKRAGRWLHQHPLFKPDFSPELLLCKNFVVHLLAVRKSLVDALPAPDAPDSRFDGAQDYNMTFLASERARRIHHVPKVLYHWRMSEGSTAANSEAKPYGKRAYRLSAQRHLERTGLEGSITGSGIVNIHNIWFRPDQSRRVSVIVARAAGRDGSLDAFLEAFCQVNSYANCEVVLVGDDAGARRALAGPCGADASFVRAGGDEGLFQQLNRGAAAAGGDVLVFADAGCMFTTPEPIEQLVGMLSRDGVGVAAPKVLYADRSVKAFGHGVSAEGIVPLYRGYPLDYPSYQCNMRAFQNASSAGYQGLAMSRARFEEAGGFDESFTGEAACADLCRHVIEQGERVVALCTVELLTDDAPPPFPFDSSRNHPDFPAGETERFFGKWPEARGTHGDPYRNPALDQRTGYPVIRYEPMRSM